MDQLAGRVLDGKYSIEKLLGRGGMGSVYLAVHLGTTRPVAIKIISEKLLNQPEYLERFKREAEVVGRLWHRNVVDVSDFGFCETFGAVGRKWKPLLWILPFRAAVSYFIQGNLTNFSAATMFVLSFLDEVLFWFLPCIMMFESYGGLKMIKRGWELTFRAFWTITGAVFLKLGILLFWQAAVFIVVLGAAAVVVVPALPALQEAAQEVHFELAGSFGLIFIKLAGVVLLPFLGVVTALMYLKTRYAGGESLSKLLERFKQTNVGQREWQRKIANRMAISGRLAATR